MHHHQQEPTFVSQDNTEQVGGLTATSPGAVPQVDLRDLLGRHRELQIRHQGESYRLRLTRLDKLILTK